jgi:MFS family permease
MSFLRKSVETVRSNFTPLQYPNFRLYLGGQAVSLIGTWLQLTAQSWVVWQLTGSEASLGIVNMLNALPLLILGAYAGVWVDRIDRRKLLIATQVSMMILAFILAALTQAKVVAIWHVYLLSFLLGVANALDLPAQQAFLGDLAGMGDVRKAVNLNITIIQVSRILGPALAGLIVAQLGIAPAFWLNGLSFVAVVISLALVRSAQHIKPPSKTGVAKQIAEGATVVRINPRLQDMFLFGIILTFFVFSIVMNILPAVASVLLNGDAATLGLLMSASGAGALISVVVIAPITQTFRRSGRVMHVALIWLAFWYLVFAHSRSVPLSMLAIFMGSMGAPTIMTMAQGLVQLMSPDDMRGRVISLFTIITFGMQPIAAVWIGTIAQQFGVDTAIQLNAVLLVVSCVTIILLRPETLTYEYTRAVDLQPHALIANPLPVDPALDIDATSAH